MLPWRRTEVLLTGSAARARAACQALRAENIPYETETFDSGYVNRAMGAVSDRMGEGPGGGTLYYLYVSRKDEARARRCIGALPGS